MTTPEATVCVLYVSLLVLIMLQLYLKSGYFLVDRNTINPDIDFHELNPLDIKVHVLQGIFNLNVQFGSMCKAWNAVKKDIEPSCQMPKVCVVYQNLNILTETLFVQENLNKAYSEIQLNFDNHFNDGRHCYILSKVLHDHAEVQVLKSTQSFSKFSTFISLQVLT